MAMYQGNWKCSTCGGEITELPFQPRSESGLTCRACYAKGKGGEKTNGAAAETAPASEPAPDDIPHFADTVMASEAPPAEDAFAGMDTATPAAPGEKPKFAGNWSCSVCDGAITSLPFTPRRTDNLKCLECFKANK